MGGQHRVDGGVLATPEPGDGPGGPDWRPYPAVALLADGEEVILRPIEPADARRLADFHDGLSEETVYRRFFNAHPHLREPEIERLTTVDHRTRVALVAEGAAGLVGVARYDRLGAGSSAEVAFVVGDRMQGRGLGTLLLEHLAAAARHRGVKRFVADTLSTNEQMQDVFRRAGFAREVTWQDGLIHVEFPIAPNQTYLDAVLLRHATSCRSRLGLGGGAGGRGDVQVVCATVQAAAAAAGAGLRAGLRAGPVLVGERAAGLAALMDDPAGTPVVVDVAALRLRRRFVAIARAAAQRLPVVAVDLDGSAAQECEQAGVETAVSWEDALDKVRLARPGHAVRGQLAQPEAFEPIEARKLVERAARSASVTPTEIATETAEDLLGTYGLPGRPPAALVAGDGAGTLFLTTFDAGGECVTRFPPLTERDAAELAGPGAAWAVRLARLVDDHPEIRRVEVRPDGPPRIWIGPRRVVLDDPFVRRVDTGVEFPVSWVPDEEGEAV